jgi:hypothetical protein
MTSGLDRPNGKVGAVAAAPGENVDDLLAVIADEELNDAGEQTAFADFGLVAAGTDDFEKLGHTWLGLVHRVRKLRD